MQKNVTIFDHPLISHKLAILRDETTTSKQFRELVEEIGMLMTYEVCRSKRAAPEWFRHDTYR